MNVKANANTEDLSMLREDANDTIDIGKNTKQDQSQGDFDPDAVYSIGDSMLEQNADTDGSWLEPYNKGAIAVDKDLDRGSGIYSDQLGQRAENQGTMTKMGKAVGGGILGGILTVGEELGYVADVEAMYKNSFTPLKDYQRNWWSQAMHDAKLAFNESDAGKIYEEKADPNSISDQIFKWESLRSGVDSSVGFGITGMGAGMLIKGLIGGAKIIEGQRVVSKGLAALESVFGKSGAAFAEGMAASSVSNLYMGELMAATTYGQIMDGFQEGIDTGEITKEEAQNLANEGAHDVVGLNMALVAASAIPFGNVFKATNKSKAIIANPSFWNNMKPYAMGAPYAFVENVYQEMIQMEQIYTADQKAGVISNAQIEYDKDFWSRMANLSTSNRAMHAGALGMMGGPMQFYMLQAPFQGKGHNAQMKAYHDSQQMSINSYQSQIEGLLQSSESIEKLRTEAVIRGDKTAENILINENMGLVIADAINNQSLEQIEMDTKSIMKLSEEARTEKGYASDYKEKAQHLLDSIQVAKDTVAANPTMLNGPVLAQNRVMYEATKDTIETSRAEKTNSHKEATKAIQNRILTNYSDAKNLQFNDKFEVIREADRHKELKPADRVKAIAAENKLDAEIATIVKGMEEVKTFNKKSTELDNAELYIGKLEVAYEVLKSPAHQAIIKQTQEDLRKAQKENKTGTENNKSVGSPVEATKTAKGTESFNKLKAEVTENQTPEGKAVVETWDKDSYGQKVHNEKSFTSRNQTPTGPENTKTAMVFSENDMVRTVDGRTMKVVGQEAGVTNKSQDTGTGAPIVVEVKKDSQGNWIESSEKIPIYDLDILRPETSSYTNKKYSEWSIYKPLDSDLRPRIQSHVRRLKLKASEGIVFGIHRNKTEEGYDSSELNSSFAGEYNIALRAAKDKDGNDIIDVWKLGENGAADIKISRIDNGYNVGFPALLKLSQAGDVTGTVIANHTTSYNIIQNVDSDGNVVRTSVNDFVGSKGMPNGKVYIASKVGDKVSIFNSDGVVSDTVVNEKTGIHYTVPQLKDASSGDYYMLVEAPNSESGTGKLTPIALSSMQMKDIGRTDGLEGSMGDQVFAELTSLIQEAEVAVPKGEIKKAVEALVVAKTAQGIDATTARTQAEGEVYNHFTSYNSGIENVNSPFFKLRKTWNAKKKALLGRYLAENHTAQKINIEGTDQIESRNGKQVRGQNWFQFGLVREITTNPDGSKEYGYAVKLETKSKDTTDPAEIAQLIGERFPAMSEGQINASDGAKAFVKSIFSSSMLTSDTAPNKVWDGASPSIQLDTVGKDAMRIASGSWEVSTERVFTDAELTAKRTTAANKAIEVIQDALNNKVPVVDKKGKLEEAEVSQKVKGVVDQIGMYSEAERVELVETAMKVADKNAETAAEYAYRQRNPTETGPLNMSDAKFKYLVNNMRVELALEQVASMIVNEGVNLILTDEVAIGTTDRRFSQPEHTEFYRGNEVVVVFKGMATVKRVLGEEGRRIYDVILQDGTRRIVHPNRVINPATSLGKYYAALQKQSEAVGKDKDFFDPQLDILRGKVKEETGLILDKPGQEHVKPTAVSTTNKIGTPEQILKINAAEIEANAGNWAAFNALKSEIDPTTGFNLGEIFTYNSVVENKANGKSVDDIQQAMFDSMHAKLSKNNNVPVVTPPAAKPSVQGTTPPQAPANEGGGINLASLGINVNNSVIDGVTSEQPALPPNSGPPIEMQVHGKTTPEVQETNKTKKKRPAKKTRKVTGKRGGMNSQSKKNTTNPNKGGRGSQGPKFKAYGKTDNSLGQQQREIAVVKKMLPQVPIEVIENVFAMRAKFGKKAIGAFDNGVVYLVNNAQSGTAYHEVFHAVANLYLTEAQKLAIAKERGHDKWTSSLEEILSNEFAIHVENAQKSVKTKTSEVFQKTSETKGIMAKAKQFFKDIYSWFTGIKNKSQVEKLFGDIHGGKFAEGNTSNPITYLQNKISKFGEQHIDQEMFMKSLSQQDRINTKALMDKGLIRIKC